MRDKVRSEVTDGLRERIAPRMIALWGGGVMVMVVSGPFGTFRDLDLWARALFWALVMTTALVAAQLARSFAARFCGPKRSDLSDALEVFVMTALVSPALWGASHLFEPRPALGTAPVLQVALYVFLVVVVFVRLRRLVPTLGPRSARFGVADAGSLPDATATPPLLDRLDRDVRGVVLRISAQDHHVEIATNRGTQTLRMRLVDAIGQMEPVEGHCTHRSHWVTRAAIVRVERESAQRTWIYLTNGDRVPVTRKYRPELEAAGIL